MKADYHPLLKRLGFPQEALKAEWYLLPDDIAPTIKLYCEDLADHRRRGEALTIGGTRGAGKTCALALLIEASCECPDVEDTLLYDRSVRLFAGLRTRDEGERFNFIERRRVVDVWYVDDLGTEDRALGAMSEFHDLMDHRLENGLPTFVTTNLSADSLERDAMLSRVVDRLSRRNVWLWTDCKSQRTPVTVSDWLARRTATAAGGEAT